MYDTVSAVLQSPPQEVCDPSRWEHERSVVDVVTGEVKRRYTSVVNGLSLTLHGERALQAERSLPKLLNGQNITDLSGPSVAAALAGLDVEIAEALGGEEGDGGLHGDERDGVDKRDDVCPANIRIGELEYGLDRVP